MGPAQEPRPRLVEGKVPKVVGARHVASHDAERLRERPELNLDLLLDVEVRGDAPPSLSEDAFAVRVVDEYHRAERLAQIGDLVDRRDVAVHREDAVADHEDLLRPAVGLLERPFEVAHVRVAVDDPLGLPEPAALDDASVIQLVRQDRVALPPQLREEAPRPRDTAPQEQGGPAAPAAG